MYWANFLHIYQPPTQKSKWIRQIADESYRKLTAGLHKHPDAKMTLNINAILLEFFQQNDCGDIIKDLRELGKNGQIEFTGSAKYHPFLPLLPEREIIRQIKLNTETCKKYLGDIYEPKGFFPPEMAYSRKVVDIVSKLGFEWIILDELASGSEAGNLAYDTIYKVAGLDNFSVFFRDRDKSFKLLATDLEPTSASLFADELENHVGKDNYILTAMDGETFGHHRPGLEHILFALYDQTKITSINMSELIEAFSKTKTIEPQDSTWALMKPDVQTSRSYSRWKNEENEIHTWQWELTDLAITEVEQAEDAGKITDEQRTALDRALHSDQYWWASAEPWWSIEMIEAGAKELMEVVLSLDIDESTKILAKDLYQKIIYRAFDWQRSGKVDEMSKAADEDVTQRITEDTPYIPEDEYNDILDNLTHQMEIAGTNHEFERAAQLRDRINELNQKKEELTKKK